MSYDDSDHFNPFPNDIAQLLIKEFEAKKLESMPPLHAGNGPGVYAIYYKGKLDHYKPFMKHFSKVPIYVGKAVMPGGRKGTGTPSKNAYNFVVKRLIEHSRTIQSATNLDIGDFSCRWLLITPSFVNTAEAILIDHYKPMWNCMISGFGIHTPGSGRNKQARSDWDMLHPGRKFAEGLPEGKAVESILSLLKKQIESK